MRIRRMHLGEQLTRAMCNNKPGTMKWAKRQAAKLRRRQEKADPEDAPRRNYFRGYWD